MYRHIKPKKKIMQKKRSTISDKKRTTAVLWAVSLLGRWKLPFNWIQHKSQLIFCVSVEFWGAWHANARNRITLLVIRFGLFSVFVWAPCHDIFWGILHCICSAVTKWSGTAMPCHAHQSYHGILVHHHICMNICIFAIDFCKNNRQDKRPQRALPPWLHLHTSALFFSAAAFYFHAVVEMVTSTIGRDWAAEIQNKNKHT